MKIKARDAFYQSLARTINEREKAMLKINAFHKEMEEHRKQVMAEHFSTIQPLLGCPTCKFAVAADFNKAGCCTAEGHEGEDDQYFRKDSDEAPLCSMRVEGEPMATAPDSGPAEFLKAMLAEAMAKKKTTAKAH